MNSSKSAFEIQEGDQSSGASYSLSSPYGAPSPRSLGTTLKAKEPQDFHRNRRNKRVDYSPQFCYEEVTKDVDPNFEPETDVSMEPSPQTMNVPSTSSRIHSRKRKEVSSSSSSSSSSLGSRPSRPSSSSSSGTSASEKKRKRVPNYVDGAESLHETKRIPAAWLVGTKLMTILKKYGTDYLRKAVAKFVEQCPYAKCYPASFPDGLVGDPTKFRNDGAGHQLEDGNYRNYCDNKGCYVVQLLVTNIPDEPPTNRPKTDHLLKGLSLPVSRELKISNGFGQRDVGKTKSRSFSARKQRYQKDSETGTGKLLCRRVFEAAESWPGLVFRFIMEPVWTSEKGKEQNDFFETMEILGDSLTASGPTPGDACTRGNSDNAKGELEARKLKAEGIPLQDESGNKLRNMTNSEKAIKQEYEARKLKAEGIPLQDESGNKLRNMTSSERVIKQEYEAQRLKAEGIPLQDESGNKLRNMTSSERGKLCRKDSTLKDRWSKKSKNSVRCAFRVGGISKALTIPRSWQEVIDGMNKLTNEQLFSLWDKLHEEGYTGKIGRMTGAKSEAKKSLMIRTIDHLLSSKEE